jgi:hypothetical protein
MAISTLSGTDLANADSDRLVAQVRVTASWLPALILQSCAGLILCTISLAPVISRCRARSNDDECFANDDMARRTLNARMRKWKPYGGSCTAWPSTHARSMELVLRVVARERTH